MEIDNQNIKHQTVKLEEDQKNSTKELKKAL